LAWDVYNFSFSLEGILLCVRLSFSFGWDYGVSLGRLLLANVGTRFAKDYLQFSRDREGQVQSSSIVLERDANGLGLAGVTGRGREDDRYQGTQTTEKPLVSISAHRSETL
jgi:hypothetical protein